MAIARILPVVSLLERITADEWRFRLVGTEIERRWDRRLTGVSYLNAKIVSPQVAAMMRREFGHIVEWPCGSWSQRSVRFDSGRAAAIETLRLPLRADDGGIRLILSCSGELREQGEPLVDAPHEIIRITQQQFVDIGAGRPGASLAGAAPSGERSALPPAVPDQRGMPGASDGTS